jgi:hypothetical protein
MPKLSDIYFNVKSYDEHGFPDGDETFSYKAGCSVSTDGMFSIEVHPDLIDAARETLRKEPTKYAGVGIGLSRSRKTVVDCRAIDTGKKVIEQAARTFLKAKTTTELVIRYRLAEEVAYYQTAEGEVRQTGTGVSDGGRWGGKLDGGCNNNASVYAVGLAARVYEKKTLTRSTGVTVTYVPYRPSDEDHHNPDSWAGKLRNFIGLDWEGHGWGHTRYTEKEIPYTEDAARFLYETVMAMFTLHSRLTAFFGDETELVKRIESRSSFLLPGHTEVPA